MIRCEKLIQLHDDLRLKAGIAADLQAAPADVVAFLEKKKSLMSEFFHRHARQLRIGERVIAHDRFAKFKIAQTFVDGVSAGHGKHDRLVFQHK